MIVRKNYRKFGIKLITNLFFSNLSIWIWASIVSYFLLWNFVASGIKKSTVVFLKNFDHEIGGSSFRVSKFESIEVKGFPFSIKILVKKIDLESTPIDKISIESITINQSIIDKNSFHLSDIRNVSINPKIGHSSYDLVYDSMPIFAIKFLDNGKIDSIKYKDSGYKIILHSSGSIVSVTRKNSFYYSAKHSKNLETLYDFDLNMNFLPLEKDKAGRHYDGVNSIGETLIKFSGSGEVKDEKKLITFQKILVESGIFRIDGHGNISKGENNDKTEIILNIKPYKAFLDFITNYLISHHGVNSLDKEDIMKYYIALQKYILPDMLSKQSNSASRKADGIELRFSRDKKNLLINKIPLEKIINIMLSTRYDIIYNDEKESDILQ